MLAHTHERMHAPSAHPSVYTHTRTHACTHTRTHARTHAHTHTHTHTHILCSKHFCVLFTDTNPLMSNGSHDFERILINAFPCFEKLHLLKRITACVNLIDYFHCLFSLNTKLLLYNVGIKLVLWTWPQNLTKLHNWKTMTDGWYGLATSHKASLMLCHCNKINRIYIMRLWWVQWIESDINCFQVDNCNFWLTGKNVEEMKSSVALLLWWILQRKISSILFDKQSSTNMTHRYNLYISTK